MHILTVVRTYLGMAQAELAAATSLMQADISEIERHPPQGYIQKFIRLSEFLGIPVDALVKNDFRGITMDFFTKHPITHEYKPMPTQPDLRLGRMGEDHIYQRERQRLEAQYPALSKLVLPFYKMKKDFPGYDILSFDENGHPYYLEVKTSLQNSNSFSLTSHEFKTAKKFTSAQETYVLCYISAWGTPNQRIVDIPFSEMEREYHIAPSRYTCTLQSKSKPTTITGIAYYRQLRELRQAEAAEKVGITQHKWSLYETGDRLPPVGVYLKMSELLEASIDDLMARYPTANKQINLTQ